MSTTQPLSVLAPNGSKTLIVRETPMTKTFMFENVNKQSDSLPKSPSLLFAQSDSKKEMPTTMHTMHAEHAPVFVHMDKKEGCHSPCQHKPACAKPCEHKPACAKPCEVKPACPKPCEQKPACPKPCEVKPACPKPCEQKPACPKPCEVKPACPKPCEVKPACPKPCEQKPVCPLRSETKPPCEAGCKNECCVSNYNNGWTWFGWIILWFIIFTILFWLIYYSLRPSFVLDTESNEVDTGKVLLASVVSALILVVVICIVKALLKSYYY